MQLNNFLHENQKKNVNYHVVQPNFSNLEQFLIILYLTYIMVALSHENKCLIHRILISF